VFSCLGSTAPTIYWVDIHGETPYHWVIRNRCCKTTHHFRRFGERYVRLMSSYIRLPAYRLCETLVHLYPKAELFGNILPSIAYLLGFFTLYLVFGVNSCQPLSAEAIETFGPMHIPIVTKGYETSLWFLRTAKE